MSSSQVSVLPGTSVHPHKFEVQNGVERWIICAETEGELSTWLDALFVNKRPTWQPDEASNQCSACDASFGLFRRRHHCRACGQLCCDDCAPLSGAKALPGFGYPDRVRVCPCSRRSFVRPSFLKNEPPAPPPSLFKADAIGHLWENEPALEAQRRTTLSSTFDGKGGMGGDGGWESMCSSRPSEENLGITPPKDTIGSQQHRLNSLYLTATNPRHGTSSSRAEEVRRAELEALRLQALGEA